MDEVRPDSHTTVDLLARLAAGDRPALDGLLGRHRPGLVAFVAARLEGGLRTRLDPSDVVQEAQLEVTRRMDDYLKRRPMPFHLWVRKTAYERLLNLRRQHRHSHRRSVHREEVLPEQSSVLLARGLLSTPPSPSEEMLAREAAERIGRAVARLSLADREVLLMRHAEELPYDEIALLLDITATAARQRYGRALLRLRQVLKDDGLLGDRS